MNLFMLLVVEDNGTVIWSGPELFQECDMRGKRRGKWAEFLGGLIAGFRATVFAGMISTKGTQEDELSSLHFLPRFLHRCSQIGRAGEPREIRQAC
jgi:hypothetical protein